MKKRRFWRVLVQKGGLIRKMCYPEKNPGTQISSIPANANKSPTGVHAAPIIS